MRVKKLKGKWIILTEASWKAMLHRFDWRRTAYLSGNGVWMIPHTERCQLCTKYVDDNGCCGRCPLAQFSSCARRGCFNVYYAVIGSDERHVKFGGTDVWWEGYAHEQACAELKRVRKWLLSMKHTTVALTNILR